MDGEDPQSGLFSNLQMKWRRFELSTDSEKYDFPLKKPYCNTTTRKIFWRIQDRLTGMGKGFIIKITVVIAPIPGDISIRFLSRKAFIRTQLLHSDLRRTALIVEPPAYCR